MLVDRDIALCSPHPSQLQSPRPYLLHTHHPHHTLPVTQHTHPTCCTHITQTLPAAHTVHTPYLLHTQYTHPTCCTHPLPAAHTAPKPYLLHTSRTPYLLHTHPTCCTHSTHTLPAAHTAHTPYLLHTQHTHPTCCTHITHTLPAAHTAHTPYLLHTHPTCCTHTLPVAHTSPTPYLLHTDITQTFQHNAAHSVLRPPPPSPQLSLTWCHPLLSRHLHLPAGCSSLRSSSSSVWPELLGRSQGQWCHQTPGTEVGCGFTQWFKSTTTFARIGIPCAIRFVKLQQRCVWTEKKLNTFTMMTTMLMMMMMVLRLSVQCLCAHQVQGAHWVSLFVQKL